MIKVRQRSQISIVLAVCWLGTSVMAMAKEFHITLKDHVFTPSEIVIPANTKVKLIIHNEDDTLEEFDSFDLNREKVLFPGRAGRIFIGPLPKGQYEYFGEYFPNSARGLVIVEAENAG